MQYDFRLDKHALVTYTALGVWVSRFESSSPDQWISSDAATGRAVNPFTDHPHRLGESYARHFLHAARFGLTMIAGGVACIVHAALPFACERTGSDTVRKLYRSMVTNRADRAELDRFESQFDWVI